MSHSSGVRGLKLNMREFFDISLKSHSSGVRGLKLPNRSDRLIRLMVALLGGAWIETGLPDLDVLILNLSHSSGVRGLKH